MKKGIDAVNAQIKKNCWEPSPVQKLPRERYKSIQAEVLSGSWDRFGREEGCTCRPFAINDDGTDPRDHNCPLHGCRGFDEPFGWCG